MLYSNFIYQAKEKTIQQLDNGIWYLEPEWKDIICSDIEDDLLKIENNYLTDWWDIENVLRLEVERRNAQNNKKIEVINWLYDVITATVEPAMLEEENQFIQNVVEYMKTNKEKNNSEKFSAE